MEASSGIGEFVIGFVLAVLAFLTWKHVSNRFDPKEWIKEVDRIIGLNRCARVVSNLESLYDFYSEADTSANFNRKHMYQMVMDQVEEDATHIALGPARSRRLFFKTLRKLGYNVTVYEYDDDDGETPLEFEIYTSQFSVVCSFRG